MLADQKAIVNIKNRDNECFKWCVLRALSPLKKNTEWISDLKENKRQLDFRGIFFPIKLNDIDKLEKMNPEIQIIVSVMIIHMCIHVNEIKRNTRIQLIFYSSPVKKASSITV